MTQPPTVPPPSSGLGSNSNYYLYSGCNPIVDLTVTINVTEDIVCQSTSPNTPPCTPQGTTPDKGFGFQLNANSPSGETIAYQQYVIALFGRELVGAVDNWPLSLDASIIDDLFNLTSVPEALTVPAGYQLKIILRNNYWRTSWALAAAGSWAGPADSGLLLYDPSGTGAFYHIGHGGGMGKLAQYEDQPGWDLVVTGGWAGPGDSGLLIYNRFLGLAGLYAITSGGGMTPLPGKIVGSTWDLAVTGGWAGPGNSGLLLYDRSAGTGAFYAVHSNGEMTLLRQYDDWRTSWDLAVTGGWAGPGNSGLLLYDQAAGVGAFYAVNSHGDMTLLQQYDDSIAGVTYIVTDNHGHVRADVTRILTSISGVNPADDLAPITAFQLDLVGPDNGGISVLSSGAGTIVYEASTPLTALPDEPSCTDGNAVTCEVANSVYGPLPTGASNTFTQSFDITQAAMIRKEGKVRRSFRVRPDKAPDRQPSDP